MLQLERQEYSEALHSLDTALNIETPLAELPEVRNPSASRRLDTMSWLSVNRPLSYLRHDHDDRCFPSKPFRMTAQNILC